MCISGTLCVGISNNMYVCIYTRVMVYGECTCQSILIYIILSYLMQLCIKSFVHFWYFVWAYQRLRPFLFSTCTDLCTCEYAVFGFLQNSCCVEGSYHCFMAGSSGKNDTTLIPYGTEGVWSAGSSGSSGVVAVMSGTSLVVSVFTVGGQKKYVI